MNEITEEDIKQRLIATANQQGCEDDYVLKEVAITDRMITISSANVREGPKKNHALNEQKK